MIILYKRVFVLKTQICCKVTIVSLQIFNLVFPSYFSHLENIFKNIGVIPALIIRLLN